METNEKFQSPFFNSPFLMIIIGGILELIIGLFYFVVLRDGVNLRLQTLSELGYLTYNPIYFFDFCFGMDFVLAVSSFFYFFYLLKFKPPKSRRATIRNTLAILHLIILPLSGLLDIIFDLLLG